MSNPADRIVAYYRYTVNSGPGGHIAVTDEGNAILVLPLGGRDGDDKTKLFDGSEDETAFVQAQRYVHENIDPEAKFYEDLDSIDWARLTLGQ